MESGDSAAGVSLPPPPAAFAVPDDVRSGGNERVATWMSDVSDEVMRRLHAANPR